MMVYTQKVAGPCGNYSYILCLNKLGKFPNVDDCIKEYGLTHPRLTTIFKKLGLIKNTLQLSSVKEVDEWLKKGHFISIGTSQGNFASGSTSPYILTQNGKSRHFITIIEDLGDRWKAQNSWGEGWGDKGCFYIMKKDFNSFVKPRVLVI